MAHSNFPPGVELDDVIFAIASDVGRHWKSLVDLLGMDARRDVQRIQHECSKAQEGSSSVHQRCAEHMFALWRSRLAQNGVPDRQAADSLIFALQTTPQLAHLADKCKDMLGLKGQTSQAEMDEKLFLTGDSGMFSSVELSETAASTPTTHAVQDRTPSLQQGQYNPTHAGTTMTATPTSVSPSAHGTTTVSQLPSRVSPSVVPSPRTNQYHSPGMTNVNSFEPDEPPPQPEPRASGRSVTSGGAPLPTPQQVSGVSRARPENYSSLPPDYPSLSDSAASQQSSSAPSEQPQLPQPPLAQATSLPVAPTVHAQSVTVGQDQQLPDDSPKSTDSGLAGQEQSIPNVIDLGQRESLFLVLDVCLRLRRRKMLAHFLGLSVDELESIMTNEVEPEEQSFQIIKKWTEKAREEATFTKLKEALGFIKEEACLQCMCNIP